MDEGHQQCERKEQDKKAALGHCSGGVNLQNKAVDFFSGEFIMVTYQGVASALNYATHVYSSSPGCLAISWSLFTSRLTSETV